MKFQITKCIASIIICMLSINESIAQVSSLDKKYITNHLDTTVIRKLKEHTVPGATYTFIKGDSIYLTGAAGFANLEQQLPMSASNSRFMMGSLSKLITTVAVLQLVEKSQADLETDINQYLTSIKIPYSVNLKQLLTHTAGLEESVLERVKRSKKEFLTLSEYLNKKIPEQIIEPGLMAAYSNHGMTLAGLVVQDVSGMSFEQYVKSNIFDPLGMSRSSFVLNPENHDLCTPYLVKNNQPTRTYLELVQTIPASMLISTADDMGKFMKDQLSGSKLLSSETLNLMQTRIFTHHPKLPGRALGFFERNYRGKQVFEHGNTRRGFYSYMLIIPEDTLGIFITSNGGSSAFRTSVIFDVLSEIYPKVSLDKEFNEKLSRNIDDYTGTYFANRRSHTDISKMILRASFVDKIKVEKSSNNTIGLLGSDFKIQEYDQFNVSDNPGINFPIAFGRDNDDDVTHLFLPGRSDSYSKLPWYDSVYIGIIVFLATLVVFGIHSYIQLKRFRKSRINIITSFRQSTPGHISLYYALMNIAFIILLSVSLIIHGENLQYSVPEYFYVIFTLPLIGLALGSVWIAQNIKNFKMYFTVNPIAIAILLLSIVYSWQLLHWNFIGYNF